MPLQMSDLKALLDKDNIRYFEDPRRPMVLAGFGGIQGHFQITIGLQNDGNFLQYRTYQYAWCPAANPNVAELLKLLTTLNLANRWLKWCWDVADGEVIATGDLWVMDGAVTQEQFKRMLNNILQVIDIESPRIKAVIETGKDPGESNPDDMLKKLGKPGPVTEV